MLKQFNERTKVNFASEPSLHSAVLLKVFLPLQPLVLSQLLVCLCSSQSPHINWSENRERMLYLQGILYFSQNCVVIISNPFMCLCCYQLRKLLPEILVSSKKDTTSNKEESKLSRTLQLYVFEQTLNKMSEHPSPVRLHQGFLSLSFTKASQVVMLCPTSDSSPR